MRDGLVKKILVFGTHNNASDIHFSSNQQPLLRIMGEFKKVDGPVLDHTSLYQELIALMNAEQQRIFREDHEVDFALSLQDTARLRVNVYEHYDGIACAVRILPNAVRSLDDLMMPPVIKRLVKLRKGLILVTGPAGSGKSTTLAAMIHEVNANRRSHIITLEDPVEYIHRPLQSLVHQREIGLHTHSYSRALINALREDPDVVLVGEMRDLETITHALQAAETGQLVLSTLHTNSATETLDRIIDVFPAEQHQQIRVLLANVLAGIVAQRLVPMAYKQERIAMQEILVVTPAIQNLIREGKAYQIPSLLQTGAEYGMQTFQKAYEKLQQNNLISPQMKIVELV